MNQTYITEQYISYAEEQIFVKSWLQHCSELAPIILFHESLGSVAQWKDFPEKLADVTRRSVIAYDRIGFGQSSGRTQVLKVDFLRDEVATIALILDRLKVQVFIVFGHSIGGGFAAGSALAFPNCLALMIESSLGYIDQKTIEGVQQGKKAFQVPQLFARLSYYHGDKAQSVLDSWTDSWLSAEFKSWSILDDLSQIQCPMMILHGENDEYAEKAQPNAIANAVNTDCIVHLIQDCGHIPHHEKMDIVLECVRAFLCDVD